MIKIKNQGFTILELLIATTIFSVILLIVTTGIIRIGNIYYKGITTSRTQESIRNISNELTSSIQFAKGIKVPGTPASSVFCLGDNRYSYFLNNKYTSGNETTSGVYYQKLAPGSACTCSGACVIEARQLLANNMRVLRLVVDPVPGSGDSVWNVSIKVAYGDNDLLSNYSNSGVLDGSVPLNNVTCKSGISGSSFCATADLDTYVKKRLE